MTTIIVASQNMTEGRVPPVVAGAGIVIGQEVSRHQIRKGMPSKAHYFPDDHQSISWDPEVLDVHRRGYLRFHRSGKAEGWKFRTPSRGMGFVKGRLVADGTKTVVATAWLLNSWHPVHPDQDTPKRHDIGRASLALIKVRVAWWIRQGYTVVLAGDFNSLRWGGWIKGLTAIKSRGLDRAYVSRRGGLVPSGRVTEGPKTGVGNDLRHHAVLFSLEARKR